MSILNEYGVVKENGLVEFEDQFSSAVTQHLQRLVKEGATATEIRAVGQWLGSSIDNAVAQVILAEAMKKRLRVPFSEPREEPHS